MVRAILCHLVMYWSIKESSGRKFSQRQLGVGGSGQTKFYGHRKVVGWLVANIFSAAE